MTGYIYPLSRDDCACCKYRHGGKEQAVQQCGHPMHNYCFKKIKDKNGKVVQKVSNMNVVLVNVVY